MSITVRVIFWGLVGLVPNEDANKGMTVLFADPGAAHHQVRSSGCQIPPHVSIAFLLQGECTEGNCLRIPSEGSQPRIIEALRKAGSAPGRLAWLLDDEHLEVTGGVRRVNPERRARPQENGRPIRLPTMPDQTDDLSWLPHMSDLNKGKGKVRESCLCSGQNCPIQSCPIQSRFKIRGGEVEACHLLHDEESVKAYTFVTPTTVKDQQQAIADGVIVTYKAEGDSVQLQSWDYSADPTRDAPRVFAKLKPQGNVVTLVMANLPVDVVDDCMFEAHSQIFFHLLDAEVAPEKQAVRRRLEDVERNVRPGACEQDLIDLDDILGKTAPEDPTNSEKAERSGKDVIVFPHTSTECDAREYTASPNG